MKKRYFVFLMISVLLLATGCLPEPTLQSDLFLNDNSLLTGEPCTAPCWHDIVPGETLWSEAMSIVQADDTFTGFDSNSEDELAQAVWQVVDTDQYCCRMLADSEEDPISYIFLTLSTPNIIVDDVFAVYGEPDYVTVFEFTNAESVVQLIYADVPMVISALVTTEQPGVMANSHVVAALYMSVDEMETIMMETELKVWDGYQSYDAYAGATPVVTPSVTQVPAEE